FFTSRSRHTKLVSEWSSAVCSSVLLFGRERADRCAAPLRGRPYDPRSPADAIAAGVAYVPEDRPRHGVLLDLDVGTNVVLAVQRSEERRVGKEWRARWCGQAEKKKQ